MKIPFDHNTSIDRLLSKGNSSIFLSDWNKQDESCCIEQKLISKALNDSESTAGNYFFMDESHGIKSWLSDALTEATGCKVNPNSFAISTNGTATLFLILYIFNKFTKLRVLLLTPIYFSCIRLLSEFSAVVNFLQVIKDGKLEINFSELESIIESNNINLVIMNDPIFGAGISFGNENYEILVEICNKYKAKLLIDYIYGGMEWQQPISIMNSFLVNLVNNNSDIIFIESISKRVFLNGIKTSFAFAKPSLVEEFEKASVHTLGTLTSPQISIIRQLYNPLNSMTILNTIENNIRVAIKNYSLLQTLLMGTKVYLSDCNSGYHCLVYIPHSLFKSVADNISIAECIIEGTGNLTIPHDRYLHFCKSAYCFRVNLVISTSTLMIAFNKLLSFLS